MKGTRLAFLIAVCFVLSMLPLRAFAAGSGTTGSFVQLDDGTPIWVTRHGTGDKAVIFLAGMAVMSPTVEFKPMAEKLVAENPEYSAYIIEYPGTGYSPETRNPRTIENISAEIDETVDKLGLEHYTMIVHSISGVYGLYYVNQHPEKVDGFVGIDISVSKMVDLRDYSQDLPYIEEFIAIGKRPIADISKKEHPDYYVRCAGYEYSKEDQALFTQLSRNVYNTTVLDEWRRLTENCRAVRDLTFPNDMPLILFVADDNKEWMPEWVALHEELITSDKHQLITFDGPHELYRKHLDEMMPSVNEMLSGT